MSLALKESIGLFFSQYSQAYSSLNADAVTAYFSMPFYAVLDGDPVIWKSGEEACLHETTSALLAYYAARKVVKIEPTVGQILPMGANRASVVVAWKMCDMNGVCWSIETGYHLIRTNDSWRICGVMQC